ncbi:hypothetical protein BX666DRAFT_2029531 [Dichotomocladium elegans]|nr:hypothetical protein BX666DRAFT_2029531 [Dichotomocladium elegans]
MARALLESPSQFSGVSLRDDDADDLDLNLDLDVVDGHQQVYMSRESDGNSSSEDTYDSKSDDVFLDYCFNHHTDEDFAKFTTEHQIETENGIRILDFRDHQPPTANDYWNLRLNTVAIENDFSRKAHEDIMNFCNECMKSNNFRPKPLDSVYATTKHMIEAFGVHSQTHSLCKNGCMLFTNEDDLYCHFCSEPQFKDGDQKLPVASMHYLSLSDFLGSMLSIAEYCTLFCETFNRESDDSFKDILATHLAPLDCCVGWGLRPPPPMNLSISL